MTGDPTPDSAGWTLTFDGRPVPARPGQSVGAALTDAGIRSWRSTRREHRPRGLFCGIGICYDCLITVDGHPNQRACLIPVRPGMRLETTFLEAAPPVSEFDSPVSRSASPLSELVEERPSTSSGNGPSTGSGDGS